MAVDAPTNTGPIGSVGGMSVSCCFLRLRRQQTAAMTETRMMTPAIGKTMASNDESER
jgi:hypothetical protein